MLVDSQYFDIFTFKNEEKEEDSIVDLHEKKKSGLDDKHLQTSPPLHLNRTLEHNNK